MSEESQKAMKIILVELPKLSCKEAQEIQRAVYNQVSAGVVESETYSKALVSRIEAVKYYKHMTGVGLKTAVEYVRNLMIDKGVPSC